MNWFTIHRSVKVWTLAFLLVDIVFWIYIAYGCQVEPNSCVETAGFGAFFFYLPFSFVFGFFGTIPTAVLGLLAHLLMGAGIGWLLRKQSIHFIVAGLVALAVVGALMFGLANVLRTQELKRETKTQLWSVQNASSSELKFSIPGEDGTIGLNLASYDTTNTKVELATQCNETTCSFADVDMDNVSYADFLASKPTFPVLFEVTSNPQAILRMRQVPQL